MSSSLGRPIIGPAAERWLVGIRGKEEVSVSFVRILRWMGLLGINQRRVSH